MRKINAIHSEMQLGKKYERKDSPLFKGFAVLFPFVSVMGVLTKFYILPFLYIGFLFVLFGLIHFHKDDAGAIGNIVAGIIVVIASIFVSMIDWTHINFGSIVLGLLGGICAFMGVFGFWFFGKQKKIQTACIQPVVGKIIAFNKKYVNFNDRGGYDVDYAHLQYYVYAPVFEYYFNGQTYQVQSDIWTANIPPIGDIVQLYINPQIPNQLASLTQENNSLANKLCLLFVFIGLCFWGLSYLCSYFNIFA